MIKTMTMMMVAAVTLAMTPVALSQNGGGGGAPALVLQLAEEKPHVVTPEEVQALALKWIGVATALTTALAGLAVFVIGKVNEVRAQVALHAQQIHALALNAPPPSGNPGSSGNAGKVGALVLLCALGLSLTSCAGSAADTDFRRRVKSSETTVSAEQTDGGGRISVGNRLEFRDPSKDGIRAWVSRYWRSTKYTKGTKRGS